jgi:hypothetical protein
MQHAFQHHYVQHQEPKEVQPEKEVKKFLKEKININRSWTLLINCYTMRKVYNLKKKRIFLILKLC